MSQSNNKQPRTPTSLEQETPDVERTIEDNTSLLLRLRQLGDCGLRQAIQLLTENE